MFVLLKLTAFGLIVAAADTTDPVQIVNYANKATGLVVLVVIVFGAIKGWWVPGYQYKKIVQERDQFLDLALKSQETSSRALDAAEKVISK